MRDRDREGDEEYADAAVVINMSVLVDSTGQRARDGIWHNFNGGWRDREGDGTERKRTRHRGGERATSVRPNVD